MERKFQKYVFYVFVFLSLWIGFASHIFFEKNHSTYPFYKWSLFDHASLEIQDYLIRVTCDIDLEENEVIEKLIDNICIRDAMLKFESDEYAYEQLQIEVNRYIINTNSEDTFIINLKKLFNLNKFNKIIVIKRNFNPKNYYLNRKNVKYEIIKSIAAK